ncbi:MAG: phosphatidic acid phosphatase [Pseudomonadales bacterium]|nr:phosphatidic acid phosphatase [Pseudomonadales bacterium]
MKMTFLFACFLTPFLVSGCAKSNNASLLWDDIGDSARRAALAPETWGPAGAAALVAAGGWDDKIQASASKHRWLMSGDTSPEELSNDLKEAVTPIYLLSMVLATPPAAENADALEWKAENVALLAVNREGSDSLANLLKKKSGRDRPDGEPDDAMPSKHVMYTSVHTSFARRNLDYVDMDPNWRTAAKTGLYLLDGMEALSRVEADKHYPADVLMGMAVGNFLANFSFNLLLEEKNEQAVKLAIVPEGRGWKLELDRVW